MLSIGIKALDFTLKDEDGEKVSLFFSLGKKVVLCFYPGDNTSGYARETCVFAGVYVGLKQRNMEIIGASRDSKKSYVDFAAKRKLPFILLSDPELTTAQAYDARKERNPYGKVSMEVVRSTYVMDENGVIEEVSEEIEPDTNT